MLVNTASTYTPCEPMLLPLNQYRPRANRARPVRTSAPTPTSCLYARAIVPFGLNYGHLEGALQELLHRRVSPCQDLFGAPPDGRHSIRKEPLTSRITTKSAYAY